MVFPWFFAFGFGAPAMLAGLGAASIPIILHLLNKRKYREMHWAAMRFLLAAIRKNQKRIRLEQLILLAVRTALILFLILAMAKPFLESAGALPALAGRRTHRVIALDASLSMKTTSAGETRFAKAKEVARRLVEGSKRGDSLSLVLLGSPPKIVVGDPSPNRDEVLKELNEVLPTDGDLDVGAGFQAIDRVLDSSDIPRKEVVILTDLQAASWRQPDGRKLDDSLKRVLGHFKSREVASVVIDLGDSTADNVAVTRVDLNSPIVTLGSTQAITATLRNFGKTQREINTKLIVAEQEMARQTVELKPGDEQPVSFTHAFSTPGDHVVEVQIDDDSLLPDNHRRLVVPTRESLKVLLVDGDLKTEPFASETDYLAEAINPSLGGSPGNPSPIRVERIPDARLDQRELNDYDVVALCNVGSFSTLEADALEAFLKQGGGAVFFLGDQVEARNYNRVLYNDGAGLLPVELGPTVGDASRMNESSFGFDPLQYKHSIVEAFRDTTDAVRAGLMGVRTRQFQKLLIPKGSPAAVALGFDNGFPAIVESRRHRGRVIVVATSVDSGWTSWPLHNSYPPIMERILLEAASGRRAERNVRVGQPLEQSLPLGAAETIATVVAPGGRERTIKLKAAGDVSRLLFEETDVSGVYQIRSGPPVALDASFAVNPDPIESDPTKLDRAALAAGLPGWNFAYFNNWQGLTADAAAVGRRGELHRYFLYGVLALLLIESVLAWIFGHHS
ncbi:MAG: hypothetical protein NVSMB14_02630 [Isosphaeraceae bacterium]